MEVVGRCGVRPRRPPGDGTAEAVGGVDMAASKNLWPLFFVVQLVTLLSMSRSPTLGTAAYYTPQSTVLNVTESTCLQLSLFKGQ
jgi:hypothetical protein